MDEIRKLLLDWYDANARTLPWRGIQDPYRTWVSETMLQQTRVETVLGYYERFLQRFPTLEALAAAPLDDVLKLWEGLGYYSRARNLHLGAQQVMEQYAGIMPDDVDELRRISGIGPYTAGAIASIAFGKAVPAVDGNVVRVTTRLTGMRENAGIPSVRREIDKAAGDLVSPERPGDFNQAMMDLGATVCVPGTPSCDRCPLRTRCDAFAAGDAEDLPVLPQKRPPKQLSYDVSIVFSGDRILMRQRTEALLRGLWVYPMIEGFHSIRQLPACVKRLTGLPVRDAKPVGEAKHVFTHQVWNMRLYILQTDAGFAPAGWRFVTAEEMKALAIPSAMKAAQKAVQDHMETASETAEIQN